MTPGVVAFMVVIAVLTVFYAVFAPTNEGAERTQQQSGGNTGDPQGTFEKYVRPAIRNFLPQTPLALTEFARKNDKTASLLARTGNPWRVTPEEYLVIRVLATIAGVMVLVLVSVLKLAQVDVLIAMPIGALVGWYIPGSLLGAEWTKRKRDIAQTLPEALDMLRICMNAGYTFPNALAQTTELLPEGITREELTRVLAELQTGRSLTEALSNFAYRCPTESVESLVRAVVQGQVTGADIADTLTYQSAEARAEYERSVDVRAAKIQTTLFFPIIGLLMPVLLIVIFGPTLATLQTAFG